MSNCCNNNFSKNNLPVELTSIITCFSCGYKKIETISSNSCLFFYECENCKTVLKPKNGDCCVFCSYGTAKCPPMQINKSCS